MLVIIYVNMPWTTTVEYISGILLIIFTKYWQHILKCDVESLKCTYDYSENKKDLTIIMRAKKYF